MIDDYNIKKKIKANINQLYDFKLQLITIVTTYFVFKSILQTIVVNDGHNTFTISKIEQQKLIIF